MREVTLQPGYTLPEVQALLDSRQFAYAELFTIEPLEGAVMRFTNVQEHVSVVAWNSVVRETYTAREVVVEGLRARSTVGIEVDEQDVRLAYGPTDLFQSWRPWPEALLHGRLDGAIITRDRAIAARPGDPWMGVMRMFSGLTSGLDSVGRSIATIKVKSGLEKLNVQMPRDLYQPLCKNTLGDFKCGIDLNALGVLGTVGASPTRTIIPWASAAASYAFGKIHITNMDSVTRVRTILRADGTHLYLTYPLDFDPTAGLEFTAFPGCARTMAACQTFWGPTDWIKHFGGYPFVPVAETAL